MARILRSLKAVIRFGLVGVAMSAVAGCSDIRPRPLAPVTAQPKTPAQRNLTPFYPALQCMDDLFVKAGRPRLIISSNQLPDRTNRISVDARSMLITALNHMTRRSGAFSFVEQAIFKRSSGDILTLERDDTNGRQPPSPVLYISGSISQLDNEVQNRSFDLDIDDSVTGDSGFSSGGFPMSSGTAIVTLDLHLVRFPSRLVVPGTAISNSMVVSRRGWGGGLAGKISQRTLGLEWDIESIESQGQAVRSLVEVGLIEMLGTYAGVPFWQCLSLPSVNAYKTALKERVHTHIAPLRVQNAQRILAGLGYANVKATGWMDRPTRDALALFQAKQGLLVNGRLDFDTFRALENAQAPQVPRTAIAKKPAQAKPKPKRIITKKTSPAKKLPPPPDDGFKSLESFVDGTL